MAKKKIFYGWFVVAGCMMLRLGLGIPNYSLGVFLKPMCDSLGISRGAFSASSTVSHSMTMLMLPLIGEWFKKRHFMRLLWVGAAFTSAAVFCYSFVREIWQFYLFSAVFGMFSGLLNSVPIAMLAANWFEKKRALATSVAFAGSGISAMVVVPLANGIIESTDWMTAFRVVGCLYVAFMLVPLLFVIKVSPGQMGQKPYGAGVGGATAPGEAARDPGGFTRNQALKTKTFWLIGACMLLTGFVFMGTQNHVVSYLSDIGHSTQFAAYAYSVIMFFDTIGKVTLGLVYEKAGFTKANILVYAVLFGAEVMLLPAAAAPAAIVQAVLLGLCAGVQTGTYPIVISRLLGDREFGLIYSNLTVLYYVGMAAGVPASGLVYDLCGSYRPAWTAYSVVILLILALLVLAEKCAKTEAARCGSRIAAPS